MSTKLSSIHLASEGSYDTVSTDSLDEMRALVAEYESDPNGAVLDDWDPREGTIITEVRAISARINQNFDAWPSEELREAHHTFVGKPVFVNHNNHDPNRARGRVVASRYVDAGEEDRYVQVLQEVEATRFPLLAKELMEGGLDSVSMGAEAREVECSFCANISTSPFDACEHIALKGQKLQRRTASGQPEDVLVYEICRKIAFFELSYVFDPADETAVASNVLVAHRREALSEVEAPAKVDTLHPDEDEKSSDDWQEFIDNPNVIDTIDVLDEPDLGLNQELERSDEDLPEGFEEFENIDDEIEENEQAEADLAQESREHAQEKADAEAEEAQRQFEQEQATEGSEGEGDSEDPDPEDDENWEDEEDDGTGGTTQRLKGGSIEAMVADDYGTFNMWVEKNGSLVASDSYPNMAEAKAAAVAAVNNYRTRTETKESKMNRTARRKQASPLDGWQNDGNAAVFKDNGFQLWVATGDFDDGTENWQLGEWSVYDDTFSEVASGHADSVNAAAWAAIVAADDEGFDTSAVPASGNTDVYSSRKTADVASDDQAFKDYLGELMNPPSTPEELDVAFFDDFLVTERPDLDQHSVDYIGDMIVDSPEDYYISHTPTYSSRRNGKPRVSRTKNRDTSRKESHMAPQRRRRTAGDNKQTPLLEETGIAQTPAEEPVALPEEGDSVANSSESDRVKSAREALHREIARDRARKARRRKASPVGEDLSGPEVDREDLFEDFPATTMTAKVRNRFAMWVQSNCGCSIREASGPGELRSWARAFSKQSGIELPKIHEAIKRDVIAMRTAADDDEGPKGDEADSDDVPGFIEDKIEEDGDNPSKDDVKESRRRRTAYTPSVGDKVRIQGENNDGEVVKVNGFGDKVTVAFGGGKEETVAPSALVKARRKKAGDVPDSFKDNWDDSDADSDDSDDDKKESARRAALRRRAMQARRGRGRTNTSTRRTADDKLDVAAPGDRVNVEKPTSGTTDDEAEASQFDKSDFDNNSGKGLENPDTTGTPGIPGGPSVNDLKKSSKASGLQAVQLAEAMIAVGLIENSSEAKFKAAAEYEKMSRDIILDRTALLGKVAKVQTARRPSASKTAGNRGTSLNSAVPPNMSGAARSAAPQRREAASATDSDLFF